MRTAGLALWAAVGLNWCPRVSSTCCLSGMLLMKRSAGLMRENSSGLSFLRQLVMGSPVVFVILLLALSGFQLPAASWPSSTIQVGVGEDATMQCPLLDAPTSHEDAPTTLSWYRKAAGRGPTLVLSLRSWNASHVQYGDGVPPDKVSAAADGSLLLRGSEESDSGVYYCGISHGTEQKDLTPPPITGN